MPLEMTRTPCADDEHGTKERLERWGSSDRLDLQESANLWKSRRDEVELGSAEDSPSDEPEIWRKSKPLVSSGLEAIFQEIERSRWILALEDDWDGEGALSYLEETWRRATGILRRESLIYWFRHSGAVPAPKISPGPNGSIDLHWKEEDFELLVNVPRGSSEPITFYGDNYGDLSLKGKVPATAQQIELILWWLLRR